MTYTVKTVQVNPYYTEYQVVDEQGHVEKTFDFEIKAQWFAEDLNNGKKQLEASEAFDLANGMFDENDHVIQPESTSESAQIELPEEIIVDGQEQVGTIVEHEGQTWLVTASEYYSAHDQLQDAQGGMGSLSVGWHSWLRKIEKDTGTVIAEQVQIGKAKVIRRYGLVSVQFSDEPTPLPLEDLAYSQEVGLYQRSKFPGLRS